MRAFPFALVALLLLTGAPPTSAGDATPYVRELLVGVDQKVRFEVRSDVVLKPRFTGIAKVTGVGMRWVLRQGEYILNVAVRVDGKRYLPFPFEPRSWDGRPMRNRRGSVSFGCGSLFQDFVMIDPATSALAPRAWRSMDHFCGHAPIHQGKWTDSFDIETPGSVQLGDVNAAVTPAEVERN